MTHWTRSMFDPLMNWVIAVAEEQVMGHTCTKYSSPESTLHLMTTFFPVT